MKRTLKYVLIALAVTTVITCALLLATVKEFYVVVDSPKRMAIVQINDTWLELNRPTDTEVAIKYIPKTTFAEARMYDLTSSLSKINGSKKKGRK